MTDIDRVIARLGDAIRAYLDVAGSRDMLTDQKRMSSTALEAEAELIDALVELEDRADGVGVGVPFVTIPDVGGPANVPGMLPRAHAERKRDGEHKSWIEIWNLDAPDWRVWDEDGRTHHCVDRDVHRTRVESLYFDPNLAVAISEGARMDLTWVGRRERVQTWVDLIEPRTYDPKWKPPSGARGSRPFHAIEFSRLDVPLLVFHDFD